LRYKITKICIIGEKINLSKLTLKIETPEENCFFEGCKKKPFPVFEKKD